MKKKQKFTFKTERPTGAFNSFFPKKNEIKLNRKVCGLIEDDIPHQIRLMVIKSDINEDGNPNCKWKWIKLGKKSESLQEAKDFLNENIETIMAKYNLHFSEH